MFLWIDFTIHERERIVPYQPHGNIIVIFIKHRPELLSSSQYILGQRPVENIPSQIHGVEIPVDSRLKERTISQLSSHDGEVIQPGKVFRPGMGMEPAANGFWEDTEHHGS